MKKLADISAFEKMAGASSVGAVSDVSVFNKLWLYDYNVPIYSHMLTYIMYGDHDEYSDPEEAEADESSYDKWEQDILDRTGGKWIIVDPHFHADPESGEFDRDEFTTPPYRGLRGDCINCAIWVEVPGDEKPDWAMSQEEVDEVKADMERERRRWSGDWDWEEDEEIEE